MTRTSCAWDRKFTEEWVTCRIAAFLRLGQQLASKICQALSIHTTIEDEIFYPAFLQAAGDKDIHHEAVVEHDGEKMLIAQIEEMAAKDDYFDAKVSALSEMIKHNLKEEERPGGMIAEAKKSAMDLRALDEELLSRKRELESQSNASREA